MTKLRLKRPKRALGVIGVGRVILHDILRAPVPPLMSEGTVRAWYRESPNPEWKKKRGRKGVTKWITDRQRSWVVWSTRKGEGVFFAAGGRNEEPYVDDRWLAASPRLAVVGERVKKYIGPTRYAFGVDIALRVVQEDEDSESGERADDELQWANVLALDVSLAAQQKLLAAPGLMGDKLGKALQRIVKSAIGSVFIEKIAVYVTARHDGGKKNGRRRSKSRARGATGKRAKRSSQSARSRKR